MRRLLVVLVVLAGLAAAGDYAARLVAQNRAAKEIGRALELESEPEVAFGGWPFVPGAVGGNISSMTVSADSVSARGISLEDVRLRLEDLRFTLREVVSGGFESIESAGGDGSATLPEETLDAALEAREAPFQADFGSGGVEVSAPEAGVEGTGDVELQGRTLVIVPPAPASRVEIALPAITESLTYESLEVGEDGATLRFSLAPGSLRLRGTR